MVNIAVMDNVINYLDTCISIITSIKNTLFLNKNTVNALAY